ncbi:MAG: hypothetical protein M1838_002472 [Thelocarpon superellum]|nr:MAG: hypothetical protein M1838_002472 [Thelocarpon superellum]
MVGDLGKEEILLCACDDGDVLGYYTRAIADAVDRDGEPIPGAHVESGWLKPFFIANVGHSAWGLAINKASRLIAVSANTHEITVFSFGLADGQRAAGGRVDVNLSAPSSDTNWVDVTGEARENVAGEYQRTTLSTPSLAPRAREHNQRIRLRGHGQNVPSVSFLNDAAGVHDRWLVSTDIEGTMIVWDIWSQKIRRRLSFDDRPYSRFFGRQIHTVTRGWGVLCLDLSTFSLTDSLRETFGCDLPFRMASRRGVRDLWPVAPEEEESGIDRSVWNPASHARTSIGAAPDFVLPMDQDDDESMDFGDDESETSSDAATDHPVGEGMSCEFSDEPEICVEAGELDDNGPPPFAILHMTERTIRFMPDSLAEPTAVYAHAMAQDLTAPALFALRPFKRLNLIASIPELGIVAVGTQMGRVALLALTRLARDKRPGFRVDAILPLPSQERQAIRPLQALLGVAAGPIQGRERVADTTRSEAQSNPRLLHQHWRRVESRRRYRLMMTYYDGTVLSYEIGRCRDEERRRQVIAV